MKKINPFFLIAWVCLTMASAGTISGQALGLNNATPNASAILDAVSTAKGVLIPRMTSAQRDAIASPATGLLVYVTDKTIGFFYWDGARWASMYSPSAILIKRKTADEGVCGTGGGCAQNNGTTLQNDDELVIALQANQSYAIDGMIYTTCPNATPDFKFAFTLPAGATMSIAYHANYGDDNTNIATGVLTNSGTASAMVPINAALINPVFISGCVVTGANAGNLQMQWSQNTNNNANTVTVKTNSYVRAMLIQ